MAFNRALQLAGQVGHDTDAVVPVLESHGRHAPRLLPAGGGVGNSELGEAEEVVGFLKQNLTDLAGHYHALYQEKLLVDERPANFVEANRWYRQLLGSFPDDPETPGINYQLADLLLEHEDFGAAARQYERTAYEYEPHSQSAAAGYAAVYAYREQLKVAGGREAGGAAADARDHAPGPDPEHFFTADLYFCDPLHAGAHQIRMAVNDRIDSEIVAPLFRG